MTVAVDGHARCSSPGCASRPGATDRRSSCRRARPSPTSMPSCAASIPRLEARREVVRAALNQEFADWDDALAEGDEVAFIPPVSGGPGEVGVLFELTDQPLDARRLEAAVARTGRRRHLHLHRRRPRQLARPSARPTSSTRPTRGWRPRRCGRSPTRSPSGGRRRGSRWPTAPGVLEIGEASVVVSVSCPHRAEAIAACKWGIDRLKEIGADLEEGVLRRRRGLDRGRRSPPS